MISRHRPSHLAGCRRQADSEAWRETTFTTAQIPVTAATAQIPVTAHVHVSTAELPALRLAGRPVGHACRPPALSLRLAAWLSALLVLLGLTGLALVGLHSRPPNQPALDTGTTQALVGTETTTPHNVTVPVRTSAYRVVVTGIEAAWIEVRSPGVGRTIFAGLLRPGESKSFAAVGGQLSILFGGAQATAVLSVHGKTVPNWNFKPTHVPVTLGFQAR